MKGIFKKIIITLLEWEARIVLKKYKPHIIAVTGSVGKTSTKDAIYTVFSESFYVRKSEKSFNSEIGIPLTILGLGNAWFSIIRWIKNLIEGVALILLKSHYPNTIVLEVGADRPGDIRKVSSWILPEVVVLTQFSDVPVHVEFFDSAEHLIEEKLCLVKALRNEGTLVVNFDDDRMRSLAPPKDGSIITYGFTDGADIRATKESLRYSNGKLTGIMFRVDYAGKSIPVVLYGSIGHQHIYPALATLALGISQGLNMITMVDSLLKHIPPPGRMHLIDGIKDSVIIDDTYNSSPIAVEKALDVLGEVDTRGRKIVVLGDMLELGVHSVEEHRVAGRKAAAVADILIIVGIRSHYTAEKALKSGMKKKSILMFNDSKSAGTALCEMLAENDIVLVKGSQSMRMERVVKEVMKEPEKAKELLVRQEEEWKKR